MSSTRMLVLGVVKIFQPVHGYDVRRELISWHADEWGSVAPGSIYNAIKTLAKDEMIEIVDTNQVGGRPERTQYRLTARGERELAELIKEALWTVRMPADPLVAVISLMGFLRRGDLIAGLEARAAQIHGNVKHGLAFADAIDDVEIPAHVREMMALTRARVGAELAWSKEFVARLRAGDYVTADDKPWRAQVAVRPEQPAKTAKPAKQPAKTAKPAKKLAKPAKAAAKSRRS